MMPTRISHAHNVILLLNSCMRINLIRMSFIVIDIILYICICICPQVQF